MKILFDPDKIDPAVPGILLLSHGPMALGVVESSELLSGASVSIAAIGLEEEDSPEAFLEEYLRIYEALPGKPLILLDIYGGTPCNEVMKDALLNQKDVLALGGMNLPMLVEAKSLRETLSGEELLTELQQSTISSVVNVTETMREWD